MLDDVSRNGVAGRGNRVDGGNLHGDVATALLELLGSGVDALDVEGNQDADLAAAVDVEATPAALGDGNASELVFSPITWMQSVTTASTVSPSISAAMRASTSAAFEAMAALATFLGVSLELSFMPTKSVPAVEFDDGA